MEAILKRLFPIIGLLTSDDTALLHAVDSDVEALLHQP
jgi:hypothetical protein